MLYRIIQIDLTIVFLHACITILDYIANIGTIVKKMTAVIRKKTSSEAEYNVLHFMKRSMHCELNHIDFSPSYMDITEIRLEVSFGNKDVHPCMDST